MAHGKLYLWARRMDFVKVGGNTILSPDHTWVTDYPCPYPEGFTEPVSGKRYWYCWGDFHSGTDNSQTPWPYAASAIFNNADLDQAECICKPNVKEDAKRPSWPHAEIPGFYSQHGVCHQVANRILWSAGEQRNGERATVKGVRGWFWSQLMWEDYGDAGEWPLRQCSPDVIGSRIPRGEETATVLDARIKASLSVHFDPGRKKALHELRAEMIRTRISLDDEVSAGKLDPTQFAERVNQLFTGMLQKARSEVLTQEEFRGLFGFEYMPGILIWLANPEVAKAYAPRPETTPPKAMVVGA